MSNIQLDPTVIEAHAKRIAALVITGSNVTQVAKATGLNNAQVVKITKTEAYRTAVRSFGDEAMEDAIAMCRADMKKLMAKAICVFHDHLDKGSLNAAIKVLEMSGIMDTADAPKEQGGITIVMPGASPEKSIPAEVVHETVQSM